MEQRVSVITLAVADIEKSAGFYKGMGWRRSTFGADDFVTFQLNGLILGLYGWNHLRQDAGLGESRPEGTFGGVAMAYNVRNKAEVDEFLADAERIGGRITRPATEQFWGGYSGYFADLDGHVWEIAWNPHWPLDEAGNITLP